MSDINVAIAIVTPRKRKDRFRPTFLSSSVLSDLPNLWERSALETPTHFSLYTIEIHRSATVVSILVLTLVVFASHLTIHTSGFSSSFRFP
jgi:hypothetical protein